MTVRGRSPCFGCNRPVDHPAGAPSYRCGACGYFTYRPRIVEQADRVPSLELSRRCGECGFVTVRAGEMPTECGKCGDGYGPTVFDLLGITEGDSVKGAVLSKFAEHQAQVSRLEDQLRPEALTARLARAMFDQELAPEAARIVERPDSAEVERVLEKMFWSTKLDVRERCETEAREIVAFMRDGAS